MDKLILNFKKEFSNFKNLLDELIEKEKACFEKQESNKDKEIFQLWKKLEDDLLELKVDLFYANSHFDYTNRHKNDDLMKLYLMDQYLTKSGEKSLYVVLGEIDCMLGSPEIEKKIKSSKDEDFQTYYYNYLPPDAEFTPQNVYRHLIKNNFGFEFYAPKVGEVYNIYNPQTVRHEKRRIEEVSASGVKNSKMVLAAATYKTASVIKFSQMGEDE